MAFHGRIMKRPEVVALIFIAPLPTPPPSPPPAARSGVGAGAGAACEGAGRKLCHVTAAVGDTSQFHSVNTDQPYLLP
eukprot:COSAG01_NODE_39_length_33243_cov_28.298558_1_plen_78_part_00